MPVLIRLFITLLVCLGFTVQASPLRIVSEPWAPYIYEENGRILGLDYEASEEVLNRMGVETRWALLPWKRCLAELESQQADAVLDIFYNAQRAAWLVYPTEPMSHIEFVMFYSRQHTHAFNSLDDLRGLKVGISPGYWYANETFRNSPLFTREPGPSHEANLGKLARNRIDLMINDRRAGAFLVHQMGLGKQIGYHPFVVSHDHLYMAFRRDPVLEELAKRFSEELQRFKREPGYAKLLKRYQVVDDNH